MFLEFVISVLLFVCFVAAFRYVKPLVSPPTKQPVVSVTIPTTPIQEVTILPAVEKAAALKALDLDKKVRPPTPKIKASPRKNRKK